MTENLVFNDLVLFFIFIIVFFYFGNLLFADIAGMLLASGVKAVEVIWCVVLLGEKVIVTERTSFYFFIIRTLNFCHKEQVLFQLIISQLSFECSQNNLLVANLTLWRQICFRISQHLSYKIFRALINCTYVMTLRTNNSNMPSPHFFCTSYAVWCLVTTVRLTEIDGFNHFD